MTSQQLEHDNEEEAMKQHYRWMVVVLLVACLHPVGVRASRRATRLPTKTKPATVEHLEGAEPTRVTLTEDAAKRLDIQTAAVARRGGQRDAAQRSSPTPRSSTTPKAIPGRTPTPNR